MVILEYFVFCAGAGAEVRSAPWFHREQREADWVLLSHSHAPTIDTAPQSPPSHQALYRCSPGPTSCQAVGRESGWPAPLSLQHNQLPYPLILLSNLKLTDEVYYSFE